MNFDSTLQLKVFYWKTSDIFSVELSEGRNILWQSLRKREALLSYVANSFIDNLEYQAQGCQVIFSPQTDDEEVKEKVGLSVFCYNRLVTSNRR